MGLVIRGPGKPLLFDDFVLYSPKLAVIWF
jgi:hypothetical protein